MNALIQYLPALPVAIPLLAGAAMLLISEPHRTLRGTIAVASMAAQLVVAAVLLYLTSDFAPDVWLEGVGVYAIGGWPAPFGIVLVVDRLSALMLTLSATVSLATIVYSIAGWDRPGQPFHPLLQFLAMGLNGAFLTGDLFNLFVFFEVLLAASYGLILRGLGTTRTREGLHYISVNLVASFLFLIGVAIIYGIVGTLNMADLARRFPMLDPADRPLFDAGAATLGIAFLIKAAAWPLNFWLPGAYSAAMAPVAASFTMLTKLGVYAALRVGTLVSEDEAAASMLGSTLFYIGIATVVAGTIGMLAAQHLARLVAYTVVVSTGILLAALGLGIEALTAPVLFYLITSVLTTATFFMLSGMTERTRATTTAATPAPAPEPPSPFYVAFGVREPDPYGTDEEVGIAIPRAIAFLGLVFVACALLVTGLPPLPGFVAKLALLAAALDAAPGADAMGAAWVLTAAVLLTGFAGLAALTRVGIRLFWSVTTRTTPRLRLVEAAPVAVFVLAALWLGADAGPIMEFLETAAGMLHEPQSYMRAVLGTPSTTGEVP